MALEYELRFGITPEAASAFEFLTLLGKPETENLTNSYFDTPDFALADAGCSLRIRDDGKSKVHTLKVPSGKRDARHEFERDVTDATPDLSADEKDALPAKIARKLKKEGVQPAFTTAYRRLAWEVKHGASVIEVALDRGTITAGSLQASISEVELELKSGKEQDVLALAMEFCRLVPLSTLAESKSARGARLARGRAPAKRLAKAVKLTAKMNPSEAFAKLSEETVAHYLANFAAVTTLGKSEPVHQMRVALRKLWAVLWAFKPLADPAQALELKEHLSAMIKTFSAARAMDVFKAETLPRAIPIVKDKALRRVAKDSAKDKAIEEHGALARYLTSPDHARNLLKLETMLLAMQQHIEQGKAQDLKAYAASRLGKLHKRVQKAHGETPPPDTPGFHHRRLLFKKQRYVMDAFAQLFPAKPAARYSKKLAKLQTVFGDINDIVTARDDIKKLGAAVRQYHSAQSATVISDHLMQWRSSKLAEDHEDIGTLQRELAAEKVFW